MDLAFLLAVEVVNERRRFEEIPRVLKKKVADQLRLWDAESLITVEGY